MNDFVIGVPFSKVEDHIDVNKMIVATREDEALGIAVGAYLAGKKPLVFTQDSGIGNCVNIITSLLKPYGIDIDLLINVRTEPEHHEFMGKIIKDLMELMKYESCRYC